MAEKIIGIITQTDSDILDILKSHSGIILRIIKPENITKELLEECHSIAVLAGTEKEPLLLKPWERIAVEEQLKKGKKVFSEFCLSLGHVYTQEPSCTRFERLCFCHDGISIDGIAYGDILDEQNNTRVKPWDITCSKNRPLLQYVKVNVHSNTEVTEQMLEKIDERAIWFDEPDNLLVCAFRISNFVKARFSPVKKWRSLIKYILEWLSDEKIALDSIENSYSLKGYKDLQSFDEQVKESVKEGMAWFEGAELLVDNGKGGLKEGLATEIFPDGSQRLLSSLRHDCMGEVSFAYFLQHMREKNERSLEISNNLSAIYFNFMQIKEEGPFKGMLRWTNQGWGVCYQDDVARTLLPELLKCLYTGEKLYLDECVEALKFLVKTTGTDGTRVFRTDIKDMDEALRKKLVEEPGNFPSAHYNAFYSAALLLAYKLTGIREFRETGIKGLETIMSVYPDTIREHSETQELCRLIMPLTYLYWTTKENKHKEWLYKVTEDLQRVRHKSGAYLEWDTGYKSTRFGKNDDECSLLTKNGDPVVDLLYSLNWLPVAFIQAHMVTGDKYFYDLWEDIARFMMSVQIRSKNKQINGGWARGVDVELMEVFALPNDLGWGPWAMETGWTVGEILAGLQMGLIKEQLVKFYL